MDTATANAVSLQRTLQSVPLVYLQCRDMRHWWEVTQPLAVRESTPDGDIAVRVAQCRRGCGTTRTERHLLITANGVQRLESLGTTYAYPEDYLLPLMAQVEHPRQLLRFELMRRDLGGTLIPS